MTEKLLKDLNILEISKFILLYIGYERWNKIMKNLKTELVIGACDVVSSCARFYLILMAIIGVGLASLMIYFVFFCLIFIYRNLLRIVLIF